MFLLWIAMAMVLMVKMSPGPRNQNFEVEKVKGKNLTDLAWRAKSIIKISFNFNFN